MSETHDKGYGMTTKIGRVFLFFLCVYAIHGAADGASDSIQSHDYFTAVIDLVAGLLFIVTMIAQTFCVFMFLWREIEG